MILDIQKGVFSIKVILELKELFQKLSCVEDIVISETIIDCNVIEYDIARYIFSYCMIICEVGDARHPGLPKRFWELILYS